MGSIENRKVLVVGASAGIGQGIAVALSQRGAGVAIAARRQERLDAVLKECAPGAVSLVGDVRVPADCTRLVDDAASALEGLDTVILAAGTTDFVEAAEATSEQWHLAMETNLIGPALVTAAAMPLLREAEGNAIYLSSNSARYYSPWRGLATYTCSKRALEALVQTLRLENPEVAFTTLVVGPTHSEFGSEGGEALATYGADWHRREQIRSTTMLEPEDHARVVIDILSSEHRTNISEIVVEPR